MVLVKVFTLIYILTSVNCQEEVKYPLDADFYIGAFFSIYSPEGVQCSKDVYQPSVEEFEAAKWTVDKINTNQFLPGGLKLGLHGKKTCGVPEKAADAIISLITTYKQNDTLLFGMLSPTRSTEAKVISQIVSSLPNADIIPMISYGATSASLNNRSLYKNFFRVIPSDLEQVKVMIQLIIELKWNYVGIIFEDGAYGEEAASKLVRLAEENDICIPLYKPFNNSISDDEIVDVLDNINTQGVKGIVYIGSGSSINWLLRNVQKVEIDLIVSESLQLHAPLFEVIPGSYYDGSKGALTTSSPREELVEFNKYWKNVSQHKPDTSWTSLAHYHSDTSVYSYYVIKAVCVLAQLIKTTFETICPGSDTVCDALKNIEKQKFLENLNQLETNLTETFPYIYKDYARPNTVKFDVNGQYEILNNSVQYELYNFQKCSNDYCFTKVGELINNILHLSKSSIKMYDKDEKEYEQLPIAQCPAGKNCDKCIPSNFADDVMFIEGDLYVIGVVPIFTKSQNDPLVCPIDIRTKVGADISESIRFAVDEMNRPNGSFVNTLKGSKIGLVILSGCESPLILKDKILRLHKGSYELKPGLYSNQIQDKILGYVGSIGSSLSIAIAETLSHLGFIQVAIASTSPTLSDRSKYPYFMRIPTADDQQSRVIVEILASLGAKYIQVLHSKGSYGEGGLRIIEELAGPKGICVANTIEVVESVQVSIYNKILPELRKHPYAKVVISFIRSHVLEDVITSITDSMDDDEFVFVGSETWGRRESLLSIPNKEKIQGSISVSLELPPVPEFTKYLAANRDENNPWIKSFWENRGSCIFPGSFERKHRNKACDLTTFVTQDPWASFAIAATYSVVTGVMNTPCKEKCPESDPKAISEYMYKNVKLPSNGEIKRVFDDNGDGVVPYTILITNNSKYNVIGHWSKTEGLKLDIKDSQGFSKDKYSSECPNDFECNKCYPKSGESTTSVEEVMYIMYVLIALVLIFVLISIVLLIVYCRLRKKGGDREPHYSDPVSFKMKNEPSTKCDTYLTAASTIEDLEKPQPCISSSTLLSSRSSSIPSDQLKHHSPDSSVTYIHDDGQHFKEQMICSI